MQIIKVYLPRTHNLFPIGDIHWGSTLVHKHGLKKVKEMVLAEKNNYVIGMGDLCEAITIDDKRYNKAMVDDKADVPLLQYKGVTEYFLPMAERLLLTLEGNHDWVIVQRHGNFIRDEFIATLNDELERNKSKHRVAYGTYQAKLLVHDLRGNLMYKAYLAHGWGTINSSADDPVRREANMQLSLKRKLQAKAGDCVLMLMGHAHKLIIKDPMPELYLSDDGKNPKQHYTKVEQTKFPLSKDLRWYICTGSFMKNYQMGASGYAERFGYDPIELGFPVVRVVNGKIKTVDKIILQ